MEWRMEPMTLKVDDSGTFVEISQDLTGEGPDMIIVPLEQINILIKWLQECKSNALGLKSSE